ncbi:MAG: hypothetical protein IKO24_03040 [Bacteroidales bacterium]|nr:hypothetical protein [Bacteroidales bacterium]
MENLTDKNIRGELIARYLEAETDAREEMLLAEYFAEHAPEADEAAVARLVLAERPEALLAAGELEFDRASAQAARAPQEPAAPAAGAARPARRLLRWCGVAAAAALALFLLLRPAAQEAPALTPLEIAESLSTIAELGLGDIESVTAVPSGASFLVTVHLKDGSDLPFIMSKDGDTGALSLASTE